MIIAATALAEWNPKARLVNAHLAVETFGAARC